MLLVITYIQELLFENDENEEVRDHIIFQDEDYGENNKKYNRVKNYSFSVGRLW